MSVKVVVREGETIRRAISRLNRDVRHATRREWYKTRPGCYTKPSVLRRRKDSLRARNARNGQRWKHQRIILTVYLTPRELWNRLDPFESVAKSLQYGTRGGWKRRIKEERFRRRQKEIEAMRAARELV